VSAGAAERVVANLRGRARQRWRRRIALSGAGAAAVIAIAAVFVWWPRTATPSSVAATSVASTVVSTPERRVLSDGSVVELKTGAEIAVDYAAGARRITLRRGEALFEVMPDAARPFIVTVGGVEVRAVGTAFTVEHSDSQVAVLVTKGRVAVSKTHAAAVALPSGGNPIAPRTLAMLDAGHRAVIDVAAGAETAQVTTVSADEQYARLAWRVPRLEFSGTPLRDAVAMFNRYGPRQLVLDAELGSLQLSGALRADDTDSLVLLLKNEFGIIAEPRGEHEIVLRRR
jgi:transmembrane sensor